MRLKVLTENIRIVPSVCNELEGEFALIFRQPTQADVVEWATITKTSQILDAMQNLFVAFEGKPDLEGEDGKVIKYETLQDFFSYNNSVITSVMTDVTLEFKRLREQVFTIEKK